MLATLRAFASERLVASGRSELVGRCHAERMVEWAEDAGRRMHLQGASALADVDESIPELRSALNWLVDHRHVESAGRLVAALLNYAVLRLRPDVLSWSQRVLAVDPDDHSPLAAQMWAAAAYAAWMSGDLVETGVRSIRAVDVGARGETRSHPVVATMRGNFELFEGRLERAAEWYGRAVEVSIDPTQRLMTLGAKALALGYAGDPRASELADSLLREVADLETALAAYVWYCAGEAVLAFDVDLARARLVRAVELARAHQRVVRARCRRRLARLDRSTLRRSASRRRGVPLVDPPLAARRDVVDAVDDAALDRRPARPARARSGGRHPRGRGAPHVGRSSHLRRRRVGASGCRRPPPPGDGRRGLRGGARRGSACSTAKPPPSTRCAPSERPDRVALTSAAVRPGRRATPCRPVRG